MLDRLSPAAGAHRSRKRVGRGAGSGHGKTSGRGQKGYGSRSGSKRRAWFEGGQMPLARRLPKRGFTNIFREPFQVVNLRALERFAESSDEVDAAALAAAGLIARADRRVKVLAGGELSGPVTLAVHAISAAARRKLEAAGGSVRLLESGRKPLARARKAETP